MHYNRKMQGMMGTQMHYGQLMHNRRDVHTSSLKRVEVYGPGRCIDLPGGVSTYLVVYRPIEWCINLQGGVSTYRVVY